jgi:hypothetical protein
VFGIAADDAALYAVTSSGLGEPSRLWSLPVEASADGPRELGQDDLILRPTPVGAVIYYLTSTAVRRVASSGGSSKDVAGPRDGDARTLAGQWHDFAVDGSDLYVAVRDTRVAVAGGPAVPAHPGAVLRIGLEGGQPVTIGEHNSTLPLLAVDEASVYVTTADGIAAIEKKTGKSRVLLAAGQLNEWPTTLVSSGAFLYALVRGEVRQVHKASGLTRVLSRETLMQHLVVRRGWIYAVGGFAFQGAGKPASAGVCIAIAEQTHEVRTLTESLVSPQQVAVGRGAVFVMENGLAPVSPGLGQIKRFPSLN